MKSFPKMLASLSRPVALIALSLSLLGSAVFATPVLAASFTVNNTGDTVDASPGNGICADASNNCTLRAAIMEANALAGPDTITLPAGTYLLTRANTGANEDNNSTGDLDVTDSLTINGAGSGSTIIEAGTTTSNGIDKVLALNPICDHVVNVTITGVTISFGRNTQPSGAADFSFTGGGVDWCGFGTGNFTLSNSVISNNTNVNGYGGGLNLDAASAYTGTVNITGVTFDHNQTLSTTNTATGGAINIFETHAVTISNSTFTNNQTLGSTTGGGAIYYRPTQAGSLTISGSTFSSNTAGGIGGAIATATTAAGTTVSITNSTFTGNTATNSFGGALDLDSTVATTTAFSLSHLTITGNHAGISGGGVYVGNSNVNLSKSLIVGNIAPDGKGIHKSVDAATATVTNNWWGCSTGPGAAPCDTATTSGGTLTFTPWYRDQLTASTSPIVTNQSTALTASFLTNSANSAVPLADLAEIIGRSVTWAATNGNLSGTQATVQVAGTTTGSFQATVAGTAIISAKVDNDNTSPVSSNVLSLTVNKANTTSAITNGASLSSTPSVTGQPVAVTYSVTGAFGNSPTAPTGNVTVSDGTDSCTGTVAAGTCNLTFKTAGSKTLTATYAGDTNFNASPASASASHTVNKADTTTTITSDSPDPSVTGQTVTFNVTVAAVAPGAAVAPTTITGTVVVSDGGTNTCNVTLTAGAGSCTIALPNTGPYSMTGAYGGDSNFNGSTSAANSHTVNKANTTTTITSDTPDPSNVGESVTVNFTVAAVTPGAGTPTGNVTVSDGVDSCTGTVASGTCNITLTTPGPRTLTATYAGDSNFNGSTSAGEPHAVNKFVTTTTITSDSPDPSVVGQAVTVQYSVTAASGTPTGNVTVSDGTVSCTGTVVAGQCLLTFTSTGAKSLTATYAGDSSYDGSTSAAEPHQVDKADTTTTITTDSPDPSVVGQSVTVQYNVAVNAPGAGTPTGNVTVSDGTVSCTGTVAAGQCSLTFTSAGAKSLTATYAGDSNFNGSSSAAESHQVVKADTTTTITSDNPDPSTVGQSVTVQYSVAVSAPGAGTPTGNITVSDGVDSCTGTVAAGNCNITLTTPGARTLTATYAGDSNFNGSTSAGEPHTVNGTPTTTTITADTPDPSVVGQSVTVQYSVTSGSGTPTGNVTVSDGIVSCTGTVAAGQCSLTFTSAGAKSLIATYAGDGTFGGSSSAAEAHQVDKANTTTTITSDNPDPSAGGQSVTVQYNVAVNAPGAGIPTGNITVSDGVDSCTGTVAAGQCGITLTTDGARTLTAIYAGDSNFNGSTSAGESHTVDNTPPAVTINQAIGQADPTTSSPINFEVVFSEPVNGFGDSASDVTLSGTAGATTAVVSGGPTTYNVAVTGMSTNGTVIASIPASVATDAVGNSNTASTSTDNTVTFVFTSPTTLLYNGAQIVNVGDSFQPAAKLSSPTASCVSGKTISFSLDTNPLDGSAGPYALGNTTTNSSGQATLSAVNTTGWQEGIYIITANFAGTLGCDPSSDSATLTVASPGNSATGGGWYTLSGSGRINFGFNVRKVDNKCNANCAYTGNLLLMNNGKWKLKGNLDTYSKLSTGQGAASGIGDLYWWDSSLNGGLGDWALAQSGVAYTINFYDSGKKGKASTDAFGINIQYTPIAPQPSSLPNSSPAQLKGGDIKVQ